MGGVKWWAAFGIRSQEQTHEGGEAQPCSEKYKQGELEVCKWASSDVKGIQDFKCITFSVS